MDRHDCKNSIERIRRCDSCGKHGCHVDTTAGEIIENGEVVAYANPREVYLLADSDGRLRCDDCSIEQ